jgi:hypothetical protein
LQAPWAQSDGESANVTTAIGTAIIQNPTINTNAFILPRQRFDKLGAQQRFELNMLNKRETLQTIC